MSLFNFFSHEGENFKLGAVSYVGPLKHSPETVQVAGMTQHRDVYSFEIILDGISKVFSGLEEPLKGLRGSLVTALGIDETQRLSTLPPELAQSITDFKVDESQPPLPGTAVPPVENPPPVVTKPSLEAAVREVLGSGDGIGIGATRDQPGAMLQQ